MTLVEKANAALTWPTYLQISSDFVLGVLIFEPSQE